MSLQLTGIHHLTAITANAKENLRFYTQILGMRLVKKTVNQDDTTAYHLFYADGEATPGTDLTFFDWPVNRETRGTHSVSRTGLRVGSPESIEWWKARFGELSIASGDVIEIDEIGEARRIAIDPQRRRADDIFARSRICGRTGAHEAPGLVVTLTVGINEILAHRQPIAPHPAGQHHVELPLDAVDRGKRSRRRGLAAKEPLHHRILPECRHGRKQGNRKNERCQKPFHHSLLVFGEIRFGRPDGFLSQHQSKGFTVS